MFHLRRPVLLATLALGLCSGTVQGAPDTLTTDVSDVSNSDVANPDSLRGSFETAPPVFNVPTPQPSAPPSKTDLSVGLRGSYVRDRDGTHLETIIAPAISMTRQGRRSSLDFDADAELIKRSDDEWRVGALRLTAARGYALDQWTAASGTAELEYSQPGRSDLGVESNVAVPASSISGALGGEVVRKSGHFIFTTSGSAGRTTYGQTTLLDGTTEDNTASNVTALAGRLRVGFELTPKLTLFTEAGRTYDYYDAPSEALGYKLDGTTDVLRAGASARLGHFVTAEGSVGVGLRRYTLTDLPEVKSNLYSAEVTYQPDETFSLTAAYDTTLGAPEADSVGTARIERAASGEARYTVNSWLALRASANWSSAETVGSADEKDDRSGVGVGADYTINSHAALTADYSFMRATISPDPTENIHRITLGLLLSN